MTANPAPFAAAPKPAPLPFVPNPLTRALFTPSAEVDKQIAKDAREAAIKGLAHKGLKRDEF